MHSDQKILKPVVLWFFYQKPTMIFITFSDFLIFYHVFLSPQMKWCVIITYEHGIYELPAKMKTLLILAKNMWTT